MFEFSERSMRRSRRICGIHVHKFPEYENAGRATDAIELGESGEKNGASCPATTVVFGQLMRTVPVRSLGKPNATPSGTFGNPPAKSNCRSALTLAPFTSGPNTSRPT